MSQKLTKKISLRHNSYARILSRGLTIVLISICFFIINGCAGYRINNETSNASINRNAKFAVFPFEDPYFKGKKMDGFGVQFARSMVSACEASGLQAYPVEDEKLTSGKYINPVHAINFARENEYDYAITGKVTKWIDRATAWSGRPDYLGIRIVVKDVATNGIVYTAEIDQHSSAFVSDTPDVFMDSLTDGVVKRMLGEDLPGSYNPDEINNSFDQN